MLQETLLRKQVDGAVVTLTLNRPDKLNAMNRALVAQLSEAVRELSLDPDVRAIVLTGEGRAFCAGLDLTELTETEDGLDMFVWNGSGSLFSVVANSPIPIITAVNGHAITGGLEMALLGDFLIASERAVFADTHARIGITPSWGLTQILPRLIGVNRARRMSLTGEFIDAETAERWGLVTEVVPHDDLLPHARALAAQIAETDRITMSRIRGLIGVSEETPLAQGLAREAEVFNDHIASVQTDDVARARAKVQARGQKLARQEGEINGDRA